MDPTDPIINTSATQPNGAAGAHASRHCISLVEPPIRSSCRRRRRSRAGEHRRAPVSFPVVPSLFVSPLPPSSLLVAGRRALPAHTDAFPLCVLISRSPLPFRLLFTPSTSAALRQVPRSSTHQVCPPLLFGCISMRTPRSYTGSAAPASFLVPLFSFPVSV